MTSRSARTGLIVVNYGSHRLLAANLAKLQLPEFFRVVVVDNPTDADERHAVSALSQREGWTLVLADRNDGFGPGANAGASRAIDDGCDVVILINPDVVIGVDVLTELAKEVRARPLNVVTPRIVHADGSPGFVRGVLDGRTGHISALGTAEQPLGWVTGAVLATSVDMWSKLDGFSGDYFMYWEDLDLSRRCLAAGGGLAVRADLVAVHHVGGTQGEGKSHLYFRYNCRNRLLFAARNLGRADVLRWLLVTPRESWSILMRGGGRRRLLHDPTSAWVALAGTLAGVRIALKAVRRPAHAR